MTDHEELRRLATAASTSHTGIWAEHIERMEAYHHAAPPYVVLKMIADLDALRTRLVEVERGLADAALSLETVASLSGRKSYGMPPIETYMETFMEVRAYAAARAGVAREAIDNAMKEQV